MKTSIMLTIGIIIGILLCKSSEQLYTQQMLNYIDNNTNYKTQNACVNKIWKL